MPIFQQGAYNTTALTVPGVYVQIIPPQQIINGLPTNVGGFIGTASWGPLNTPTLVSNLSDFGPSFGTVVNRQYDLGTAIAIASQQGRAGVYSCVRVSDNTDTAATAVLQGILAVAATGSVQMATNPTAAQTLTLNGTVITFVASGATGNQVNIGGTAAVTAASLLAFLQASADAQLVKFTYAAGAPSTTLLLTAATAGTGGNSLTVASNVTGVVVSGATLTGGLAATNGIALTARYTGSLGNTLTWFMTNGTTPNTFALIISLPGYRTERIDNVAGAGNAFWVNLAAAINSGNGFAVPASQLIIAAAGPSVAAPIISTVTAAFSGGTDGVGAITPANLVGTDGAVRKGMYTLRGMGCSSFALVDVTDTTTFATQLAFAANEATEAFVSTPSGDTIANAVNTRNTLGLDNYALHIMVGDFLYWFDSINNVSRYLTPSSAMVGLRSNLAPHLDTLNKPIQGISGTQRTQSGALPYSDADMQTASLGRVDVIAQPPQYALQKSFTPRLGQTSSSDEITRNDSYTQMINYIARTYAASLFTFIGKNQGFLDPDDTRNGAKAAMDGFLQSLQDAKMIQAFNNQLDALLNPPNRVMIGYMRAKSTVQFYGVVRYFLIDLQGGVTVNVQQANQNFQPLTNPVFGLAA